MALSCGLLPIASQSPTGAAQALCSLPGSKIWQSKWFTKSGVVRIRWPSDANQDKDSVKSLFFLYTIDSAFLSRGPRGRRNARGSLSGQELTAPVEGTFGGREVSAESAAVDELSKEEFANYVSVEDGAAAARQQNTGRFKPRFPGQTSGKGDVTVPAEALRQGATFKGIVSSIQSYGAFVNFGAFADGLVHISKLSTGYVRNVSDVVTLGQEVTVTILNVERSSGRISLSMVEKDETESWNTYLQSRKAEPRDRSERPRFQPGPGRVAPPKVSEKGDRVPGSPYASHRPEKFREGGEWPRFQPGSARTAYSMEDGQERASRIPYAPSTRQGKFGGAEERPVIQAESGRKAFFRVEKEGSFLKSSSTEVVADAGSNGSRFQQGNDGKFLSGERITVAGGEPNRVEAKKPKKKLVQIQDPKGEEGKTVEDQVRSRMRSWYECDCCY